MSPGAKLRVSHSRLGCLTCKIRRVKCDETQPECLKCTTTGRKCEGPSTNKFAFKRYKPKSSSPSDGVSSVSSGISRSPSPLFTSPAEARAFDFYLHQAAPSIAGPLDGAFWAKLLPQLCQFDLTIRQAVLAVSVFYEQPFREVNGTLSREQAHGIRWYKQSVAAALAASIARDDASQLEHSLLTCMLFIVIEMQHANPSSAMHLLGHGYKLIALYLRKQKAQGSVSPWMAQLLPMFARQASLIGYRLPLPPDFDTTTENLLPTSVDSVSNLADARDVSHFLSNRALALHRAFHTLDPIDRESEIPGPLLQEQQEVLQCLQAWEQRMHSIARSTPMTPLMRKLYHALLSYERGMVLFVSRMFAQSPDPDEHDTAIFIEVLDHAEASLDAFSQQSPKIGSLPSVQDMGVLPGICVVGWKCQDEPTRQRAAALLKRAALQENLEVARQQVNTLAGILKGDPTKYDRSSQNGFEDDIFAELPVQAPKTEEVYE